MILKEGLKVGDLKDLAINTISIDQYESKIDDNSIVVAFYILYRQPAIDLNRFIQKSAVDILDTEMSPAPTEDGYYVIFVELSRNSKFPQKLMWLVNTLKALLDINDWYFRSYKNHNAVELNLENIKKYVDTNSIKENIMNYFKNSILESLEIKNNNLIFERNGSSLNAKFIGYGYPGSLFERFNLNDKPFKLDESAQEKTRQIASFLGENWDVENIDDYYILNNSTDKSVIIKLG